MVQRTDPGKHTLVPRVQNSTQTFTQSNTQYRQHFAFFLCKQDIPVLNCADAGAALRVVAAVAARAPDAVQNTHPTAMVDNETLRSLCAVLGF
jgi:hypothetical protein